MDFLQLVVLAVVQGITEFLPISSSGHLVLVPLLSAWPDQGLMIDVAVHVGSLGAVVVYLAGDLRAMVAGTFRRGAGPMGEPGRRLVVLVAIATMPVVVVGAVVGGMLDGLRRLDVIGWTMLVFGVALWLADQRCRAHRRLEALGVAGALTIGCAQVLALVPGTSRAGITMTAARALGLARTDAARFSMLLSIPTIAAAGLLLGVELVRLGELALTRDALLGAALAFGSALVAIIAMMRWLRHASFTPFVVYRVLLGVILLALAYG
ncbi:MAG: undecaprenyl-diphosphate phosphatase [Alphaproteobacteria bacterium]|jgi:undecaprenyl-diphosphatase|nr:undecaprenyl-diphosphate phosphatase [Alphaproteobacteria bacterium]